MKKLAFLMSKLRITEKKLGELISVDKSLINKWKNGKRVLSTDSQYILDIADAFAYVFDKFDYQEKVNFKNDFPFPFELNNPRMYFASFLKNKAINENSLTEIADATAKVDSIVGGDPTACKKNYALFFEKLKSKRNGTLSCYISAVGPCDRSDIMGVLYQNILEAMTRDIAVEIIFDSFGKESEFKPLLYFSDFFYSDRLKLYIKKNVGIQKNYQTFFIYEKDIALEANYICDRDKFYCEIFADSVRCEFTNIRFQEELKDSVICFEKMSKKSHQSLFSLFQEHGAKTSPSYLYLGSPLFIEVPFETIKDALSHNSISADTAEVIARRFLNVYSLMLQSANSHNIRMMFSMESFEKLVVEENHYIFLLSMFCNQNITVPRKAYRKMLKVWVDAVRNMNNLEIMLTPKDLTHRSISCYVKKYYFSTMWQNSPGAKELLFTEDSYNSQLLYSVIDKEWDSSKTAIRDKELVLNYITDIADRLV